MELTGFDVEKQKYEAIKPLRKLSPANYVTKHTVPTLIFHGNQDDVVDVRQSEHLVKKLQNHKIKHQYFVVHNANHTFNNISSDDANNIAQKTVNFVKHYTKRQE
ncbi:alpha/beta hydrolase family protein [Epilithonimonas hominis]|uniref:alpha/beta hydrolase family protein n=1 Tax=Epilithonimonas hominis TaxID=420404 RepID=UPI001608AAB5|nr:prolyl oligopeptidase family serine peptidase [Epilithonimonas hominis]